MEPAEEMGMLALVLGDFHIPHRIGEVPAKYKGIFTPNQFAYVLCTGNSISEDRESGEPRDSGLVEDTLSTSAHRQG